MFESLAQRLLNSILGEYIENFSAQNLKIGIWSGQVVLKNVVLKKSIIKKLNLPFKINYSRLGCLKMNIPWKSLTSSKIEVLLEGFELVISEIPVSEWDCKNTKIIEKRKKQIQSYCEAVVNDFAKKNEKQKNGQEGYFSKLIVKIIDNLQITVRDIHIRYEDQLSKTYSFGVTLQEFKLYTVNSKGDPEYVDRSKAENINQPLRKKLQLYNIGVYWNQKSQHYNENNYEIKMASTIAKRGQKTLQHNYLILMSSQAELLQREPGRQFVDPQIKLQIDLKTLKIQLSNIQLQQIITLAQRLQRYSNKVKEENRQKLNSIEIKANQQFFNRIFPDYYNQNKLSKSDNQRLQKILQKMQIQHFTKYMKSFLQQKEKQRLIKQKKDQKKGWWFGKPKQLTQQQLKQVQDYLNNNFGEQIAIIKRPSNYYYINIGFKLQRLELVIANSVAVFKEGIQSKFDGLDLRFRLRDGGYSIQLSLDDIGINLFKQVGVDSRQQKPILYKLYNKSTKTGNSYLNMIVTGNPLNKKHLDTQIKLTTSEIIVSFDPKIISIATQFADLNVSKQNKEAAIQKFGQIKEITQNAVAQTINKPVKKQIGVDVVISSICIAVPFCPKRPNSNCWVLNLGVLHFTTDQQILLASLKQNQPLNIFNLELTSFSFRHYQSVHQLKQSFVKSGVSTFSSVIDNLDFKLRIEMFSKATEIQEKIKIVATLPSLSINLNQFTYTSILKIGDAFEHQEKVHQQRVTMRINQKKQIQQKASKIGFVHIKDSITKLWKKYVAIMSQNYIYLYVNKNDKEYYAFYYIKGATLQKYQQPLDKQKPFHFKIKNKVNQVVFGFDKQQQIDDWMQKIKANNKQQQFISQVISATALNGISGLIKVKPQKQHNKLNLFVYAEIQSIAINVFTTDSLTDKVANLKFGKLSSKIYLHESKTRVSLQLLSLQLQDTIEYYKNKHLRYFLQTKRNREDQNLINLDIEQLNKDHPYYDHTDTSIDVAFGTLICNYKCQTVKTLMGFFIPPPSQQEPKRPPSASMQSQAVSLSSTSFSVRPQEEIYSLKLKLKIQEISVFLVNEKVKTILGKMGITRLSLYTGISQKRMVLIGSLKDLYFIDVTGYPNTIYLQQQAYPNERYLLTANIGQDKNMLDFNIQILKQLNLYHKKMLIDVKLANLTAYYVQQPVLRIITYLNTQMLPSFQTEKKEDKIIPLNDTKPEPTTMDLKVQLANISVFVQTQYLRVNRQKQQYMQLNIQRVSVKNDSIYKPYIKGQQKKSIILVENYLVALKAMSISVHYFNAKGKENLYKLTNNLDLTVSTDLIANPQYYKKELPDIFQDGLRVSCSMTPFFMRLNHDDYSFIMKCLNWGITHDDGLETQLFNVVVNQSQLNKKNEPVKDPFYLTVDMNCISLFITQSNLPIAFLLLDNMVFNFTSSDFGMNMDLVMKNLYGTSIQYNQKEKTLSQRGIFNSLGYSSLHKLQKSINLQDFIVLFDRRQKVDKVQKRNFLKCVITISDKSTDIQVQIDQLFIDVDVRLLMILSTLANTDERYIKGPQPIHALNQVNLQNKQKEQHSNKKFSLLTNINKLVGSISDEKKQKFVIVQGQILFTMLSYGEKSIEEIQYHLQRRQVNDGVIHSSIKAVLKNFSIYFTKIKQQRFIGKRQFLRPMIIDFDQQKFYTKGKQTYFLSTEIRLKTNQLFLSASLKDILIVNKILQDNLKILSQFQSQAQKESLGTSNQESHLQLQQIQKEIVNSIQSKMKLLGMIAPIQIQVINDCDNNFMPVLRLLIQDTKPALHSNILNSQIFILPIMSLYFFNPRSSRWEPIIQTFKVAVNYTSIKLNTEPYSSISVKTNSIQEDETSSLKINVSTQMLSTLMATKDMLMVQKENIDNDIQAKQIQVSPFIFHNLTNEKICLIRGENEMLLNPLFHGPIRLVDDKEIVFQIKGRKHKFSLDHYGVLKIPQINYFIRFGTKKLNRVITFLPLLAVKNHLEQPVYIRRFGNVSQVPLKVQKNQCIPLDGVEQFAVSLNGNSYTQKIQSDAARKVGFLLAQKKNFVVLLKIKQKLNNYTFINLLSPFIIFNCLPKEINMQFIHKAKTKSTVAIKAQKCYSVFANQDISTLQLKALINGYTWSGKFKYSPHQNEQKLKLQDEDNCKTILNYIFRKDKDTNQFILIIYCKRIIVNELEDKLLIYANLESDQREKNIDKFQLLGGQKKDDPNFQDKIILLGEQVGNKLRVCGSNSIMDFATPILIGGIDSTQARIVVDRSYQGKKQSLFSMIGVDFSGMKMTKQCDIFCKKITLRSKHIVINNTKIDLTIRQEIANNFKLLCEAGTKKSFVFSMPEIKNRQNRYIIGSKGFLPSKLLRMPAQGSTFFKLQSEDKKAQIYLKIYVQEASNYHFYQISQISQNDFPYEVVVKSNLIKVHISSLNLTARKGDICRFINQTQIQDRHSVELMIYHSDSKAELSVTVFPDDLKFREKHLMLVEKGALQGNVAILVQVVVRDKQKAIIVDELSRSDDVKEVGQSLIGIELAEVILSINQNSQSIQVPYQSMVITLRRLTLIKLQTDRKKQYQLKLGFLQIDQAYPYILSSPVIVTPYKYELFTKQTEPKSIFNFTIVFSKQFVRNTFINQISVDFDDIVATFSADFINLAISMATQFSQVINYKEDTYLIENKLQKWKQLQIPPQGNKVFIKSIKISPFVIDLSAQLNINKLNFQNNLLLNTIMSSIGVVMSNIDGAPILMTGIQINDCIDSVESIVSKLTAHYKSTCLSQLYKVFGSLNIIGNPLSLFRNISTGVKDLTEKPAEGFVKGPAQFGIGIVQGTGSLIAHSVGGAFNSVSKLTGTVSTGLAALAFDKDFEEHREKQKMKKPQNVIQGLSKGGKAVFYGFKEGITGIWMQPFQNAKKEGAIGFFKGAAKGLAGLVIKPVTGIIDFASKTTEGIKNNVLMFQDKPNQTRMRYPRVFYTQCFILKEYCQRDSQLYSIMKKVSNQQQFINPIFYDAFETVNGREYLIILYSSITYINIQSRKVKWSIQFSELELKNDVDKKMLLFRKKGKGNNFFNVDYDVSIEEDQVRELVAEFILTLQRQRLDNL